MAQTVLLVCHIEDATALSGWSSMRAPAGVSVTPGMPISPAVATSPSGPPPAHETRVSS